MNLSIIYAALLFVSASVSGSAVTGSADGDSAAARRHLASIISLGFVRSEMINGREHVFNAKGEAFVHSYHDMFVHVKLPVDYVKPEDRTVATGSTGVETEPKKETVQGK